MPDNVIRLFPPDAFDESAARDQRKQMVVRVLSELIDYSEKHDIPDTTVSLTDAIESVIATIGQGQQRLKGRKKR